GVEFAFCLRFNRLDSVAAFRFNRIELDVAATFGSRRTDLPLVFGSSHCLVAPLERFSEPPPMRDFGLAHLIALMLQTEIDGPLVGFLARLRPGRAKPLDFSERPEERLPEPHGLRSSPSRQRESQSDAHDEDHYRCQNRAVPPLRHQ